MPDVTFQPLSTITPDRRNARKATQRGLGMLERSLRECGAGRSVLLDRHGRIIAGNKTVESAAALGLDEVMVVRTDGKQLVAVVRTDLDLEEDEAARSLAYYDNRTGELSEWDLEQVQRDLDAGVDLSALWDEPELAGMLAGLGEPEDDVPETDWPQLCGEKDERQLTLRYTEGDEAALAWFIGLTPGAALAPHLAGRQVLERVRQLFAASAHPDGDGSRPAGETTPTRLWSGVQLRPGRLLGASA